MKRHGVGALGKLMRGGVSALALGLLPLAGAGALMGAGATLLAAAPAEAQGKAPKPPKLSKEFGQPFQAAAKAAEASDWATALAKVNEAAPHAKTPTENLMVEQIRSKAYANTGDKAKLVPSLEIQIASGLLDAESLKTIRGLLPALYAELGDQEKALTATRAFVVDYGGTAGQNATLARFALRDKNFAEAISYGEKSLTLARAEGKTPEENWHRVVIQAKRESGDAAGYANGIAAAYADYPKPEYIDALVATADKAPRFELGTISNDIYRVLAAAEVKLSTQRRLMLGQLSARQATPIEAETILKPLFDSGEIGGASDPKAADNKALLQQVRASAEQDRKSGLASTEAAAAKAATGALYATAGDVYLSTGDYAKAAALIEKGIAKGGLKPEEMAMAQLDLGVAKFKSGDVPGAIAAWEAVKADNGAEVLARAWLLLARK